VCSLGKGKYLGKESRYTVVVGIHKDLDDNVGV